MPVRKPAIHQELIEGFVDSLRAQRRARSTLNTYYRALRHIMSWPGWDLRSADMDLQSADLKNRHPAGRAATKRKAVKHPKDITRSDAAQMSEWIKALKTPHGENITAGTQAMTIRVLKLFFQWLVEENRIIESPVEHLALPGNTRKRPKTILSEDEVKRLIEAPEPWTSIGLRDRAIIETLYSTGMRTMEFLNLQIADVDTATGHIRIRRGKGNKERVVPLCNGAVQALKKYLKQARPLLAKTEKNPAPCPLFITWTGTPFTAGNIAQMLRTRKEQAGIKVNVSPYTLRRTCATHLCRAGMPLTGIQQMLGHENLTTTQEYLRIFTYETKETHNTKHPRERLEIPYGIDRIHRGGAVAPAKYAGALQSAGH